jgi:hypothetical protein
MPFRLSVAAVGNWCRIGRSRKGAATYNVGAKTVESVTNGKDGERSQSAPAHRDAGWKVCETEQSDKEEDAADYMAKGERRPSEQRKICRAEKDRCKEQQEEEVESEEPMRWGDTAWKRIFRNDEGCDDDGRNSTNAKHESDDTGARLDSFRIHWMRRNG